MLPFRLKLGQGHISTISDIANWNSSTVSDIPEGAFRVFYMPHAISMPARWGYQITSLTYHYILICNNGSWGPAKHAFLKLDKQPYKRLHPFIFLQGTFKEVELKMIAYTTKQCGGPSEFVSLINDIKYKNVENYIDGDTT